MKIGNYTKEECIEAFKNANDDEDKLRFVGVLLDLLELKDAAINVRDEIIEKHYIVIDNLELQNIHLKTVLDDLKKEEK